MKNQKFSAKLLSFFSNIFMLAIGYFIRLLVYILNTYKAILNNFQHPAISHDFFLNRDDKNILFLLKAST